ncbi:MAG: NAD(P)/FAD-dependent oxidoreductase [Desulfuromonadaceae bacterium]|nr:NAD(P)/FAD-dependent oxidoreductase [Desulfuromonadaceae bacterium]
MNRREFIRHTAIGVGAVALWGPQAIYVNAGEILPKKGTRVVVAGGGFGGASTAKHLKMMNPKLDVVLIEEREQFISCPVSNLVIGGLKQMKDITFSYTTLARKYGVKILNATVLGIDPVSHRVETSRGSLSYDRMILSPGIDYMYENIAGMDENAQKLFPHGIKAGDQTVQLRQELTEMKPGEQYLLTIPEAPFRCPPGPYERVCMVANYLKKNKPGSKIIVLDANQDIVSKGKLFKAAWKDYYGGIIEYHPDTEIKAVKAGSRTIVTPSAEYKGAVLNIIPEQKAGKMAFMGGLTPEKRRWTPVSALSFESTIHKDVHIIGDATDGDVIGSMPKSGFVASAMGKAAAATVVAMLAGREPLTPYLANTCYSMVNEKEGIYVTGVFEYDPQTKKIAGKKAAGGVSPARSERLGFQAEDWARGIWSDTLG